jgi:crossover junction endodeoxyribonuclease RusA
MHVEYVVLGSPISNQSTNRATLVTWKAAVEAEARKAWTKAPLKGNLKAILIHFHRGEKPTVDVDNMSKPIHDMMNKLVYDDDRQIRQAEIVHVRIGTPLVIVGVSKMIVDAIQVGKPFVYIRIEDPVDPYPLPK